MKSNLPSIDKMIKSFDKELKSLLLTDLKLSKMAKKTVSKMNFSSKNELRFA